MEWLLNWCSTFEKLAAFRQPSGPLLVPEEESVSERTLQVGEGEGEGEGWQQYIDPTTFRFQMPDQPFTQFIQQYPEDAETLIANEGTDILDEPAFAKWQPDISQILVGYQRFHEMEDTSLKDNIGRTIFELIEKVVQQLPTMPRFNKLRYWLEALQKNVSQDMPESLEERQMRARQEIEESKHKGRKHTREMPDKEFEALLESMQEKLEAEVTRRFKDRPTRRVRDRQRYLEQLLTQWKAIEDPEEKERMKARITKLLERREALGLMAG